MPTLGGRWPGLGAAGGSARAASSPLGAAYLPRGRQGPVHVEEAERRAARSHDLRFHAAPNRTRWHLELGTELPGSAPVPQSTPGGEESTPTMLKTSFSCSLWTTDPRLQCVVRRLVTAEHAPSEIPGAGGIRFRQQAARPW